MIWLRSEDQIDDVLIVRHAADVSLARPTTKIGGHDQASDEHLIQVAVNSAGPMCTSSVLLNGIVINL